MGFLMRNPQFRLDLDEGIDVDIFAGAGGVSDGMEAAHGKPPDVAINHDEDAVSVHTLNHPQTRHMRADVREVDVLEATGGRRVRHLHLSPDCTHHSQARGGQPRSKAVRALAWIGVRWAGTLRRRGMGPDVLTLENVEQMLQWSPLVAKRDKATRRVVKIDRSVAAPGERVPQHDQFLVPNPKKKGHNWDHFIQELRDLGGNPQWRKLNSADYGNRTATRRERLVMVCRFDGKPIVWPEPERFKRPKPWLPPANGKKPWLGAYTAIDFSRPCRSIFDREKPLAEATMRRIALGVQKYVLDCPEPFVVRIGQTGGDGGKVSSTREPIGAIVSKNEHCLATPLLAPLTHTDSSNRARDLRDPAPAITGANRGELALIAPTLAPLTEIPTFKEWYAKTKSLGGTREEYDRMYGPATPERELAEARNVEAAQRIAAVLIQFRHQKDGKDLRDALPTITAGGQSERPAGAAHAMGIAAAFLAQMNGGYNETPGHDLRQPTSTINCKGAAQQLVTAHLVTLQQNSDGRDIREPVLTMRAGGTHHGIVQCTLTQAEVEERGLRCAAFLMRYHGTGGQWTDLREPATAITTKDRLALVTVWIEGQPWVIVDIGLRMLEPDELKRASGFQDSYILTHGHDGRRFPKSKQVKFVGNAVPPEMIEAVIRANFPRERVERKVA
jgi:DNA (cytosine-5)-methyltransferase 1